MSRNTKIILGILAGILLLCVCIGVVATAGLGLLGRSVVNNSTTDPAKAATTAHTIADYQLPAGWQEKFSMGFVGITMVAIQTDDPDGYVMLMQLPASMAGNEQLAQQQMEQALQKQLPGAPGSMDVVSQRDATIRGQAVKLNLSQGTNSDGRAFRGLSCAFRGKNGPALLAVIVPTEAWNEQQINQFIASIR